MYSWLDDALENGGVVVTANRRLAHDLRAAFDEQQIAQGRDSWLTASVLSLGDWLQQTVDNAVLSDLPPRRLDSHSASVLWERCLQENSDEQVLSFGGVVRQAAQSWQRLHDWRVPLRELIDSARSRDEQLFANAAWAYQKNLQTRHWIDSAGLSARLSNLLGSDSIRIPARLTLTGFDRLTPATSHLLQQLADKGCVIAHAPIRPAPARPLLGCFHDTSAELRAAGAWAREELLRQPELRLAIVSATLEQDAAVSVRLIREGFVPGWQYGGSQHQTAVNVSYGRRLADFPLIDIALLALRWASDGLVTHELNSLLRSPFVAGPVVPERTRLELRLREFPSRSWSPGDIEPLQSGDAMESWRRCMSALEQLGKQAGQERSPSEWAARIDQVLQEISWPGIVNPGSVEFQLINRWRELLNALAGTEHVEPRLNLGGAIRRLAVMASEIIYQPETAPGVLQVLGKLEAAGMEFDKMWICGLDAANWPAAGRPSYLISRLLQRSYELPDATPQDTLEYSRRLLHRLAASASEIVFSRALMDNDSELSPSPLLEEFDTRPLEHSGDPGWHAASLLECLEMAEFENDPVPAVRPGEKIAGGAYTVQLQSIEPFAAFAAGRLRISRVPRLETGLSPSMRGRLIHQVLHSIYRDRPAHADICRWSEKETGARIDAAVSAALAPHLLHADALLGCLLNFERIRLAGLMEDFLRAEIAREDFSVAEVERSTEFQSHGLSLGLRMDRVDKLPDGSLLVIDYKTGAPRNLLNKDGDPADLQLVVYSCALDQAIGGLALVNVDSRAISYKATGGSVEWVDVEADEWSDRLTRWQALVDRALRDMAGGDARVNLQLSAKEGRPLNLLSRLEEYKRDQ